MLFVYVNYVIVNRECFLLRGQEFENSIFNTHFFKYIDILVNT